MQKQQQNNALILLYINDLTHKSVCQSACPRKINGRWKAYTKRVALSSFAQG